MRFISQFVVACGLVALCSCSRGNSGEVAKLKGELEAAKAEAAAAKAEPPKPKPARPKLYTDEEIRKLAKYDIDKESRNDRGLFGIPCLDVVPPGESYPRAKVFKALNIEDQRIQDFRHPGKGRVVFLMWQVSPSYDISCMTGANDPDNPGLELTDPKREVYGIRLVKRSK